MKREDVERNVSKARGLAGLVKGQKPRLLSDNGSCYIAAELKSYLKSIDIIPIHGRVNHPQTQGKIERYHRTMKNVVKINNYYYPEELIEALKRFVKYYNNERYHESLNNVTPADVYWGRNEQILKRREKTKIMNMKMRRTLYAAEKLKII